MIKAPAAIHTGIPGTRSPATRALAVKAMLLAAAIGGLAASLPARTPSLEDSIESVEAPETEPSR